MNIEVEFQGYVCARLFYRVREPSGKILSEEYLGSLSPEFLAKLFGNKNPEVVMLSRDNEFHLKLDKDSQLNLSTQINVGLIKTE